MPPKVLLNEHIKDTESYQNDFNLKNAAYKAI